jgi:phage/plasmid primase-like uncharacterized protein
VRFTIKDGIKNVIEDSNIEMEELANRSKSLNKLKEKQKKKAMSRSKSPKSARTAGEAKKRNVSM